MLGRMAALDTSRLIALSRALLLAALLMPIVILITSAAAAAMSECGAAKSEREREGRDQFKEHEVP